MPYSVKPTVILIPVESVGASLMRIRMWSTLAIVLCTCCLFGQTSATSKLQEIRRVLIFYEEGRSTTAVALADREIRDVLEKQKTYRIELYVEYMETNLFVDPVSQQKIRDWYIEKYRDHQPDVIIAGGSTPLQFMLDAHEKYFANVPIVGTGIMSDWSNRPGRDSLFTGTWLELTPEKTLAAALRLEPGTKQVIVVNGASSTDKAVEALMRKSFHGYQDKVNITYLSGLPMSALLPRLRNTADHTIIIFGYFDQDGTGERFISATQSLPMVLDVANAPVFTMADTLVGQGAVGGDVQSWGGQGRIAAEDVMKLLNGERPQDIPIVKGSNVYLFDWRALKRWGLKGRSLPSGSIVLNRQPTLLEAYGRYVFGGLFLLFVQLLLILELLRQRAKERTIRHYLHESEARLREAQSIAQCGSWVWDITKSKVHWSDEMYRILGLIPGSVTPMSPIMHSGNELQHTAKMKDFEVNRPYSVEHRIVRPNGEERVVVEAGQPRYDLHQRAIFVVGTLLDVTEHRLAERVLRESEERFRTMADGAPIMMWMAGVDKLCTDFNRGWLVFTGRTIEQELGNGWAEGVYPDDLQRCLKIYTEAFDARQSFTMEYRLRQYDGGYHWISDTGSPRFLTDGTFAGYIGCCLDIHDRKGAELARLELARRLMNSQEAERSRIARELHDGIGQEIALLGIQMQRATPSILPAGERRNPRMQQFSNALGAIGVHLSRLSHQLHSAELEYLGLTVAITKSCREFSEQYPIKVTCTCTNIPTKLDDDVALTLFRIVQESLHNVAKHSSAKTVWVEMTGTTDELSVAFRDDGVGFDVQRSKSAAGLGLVSIRERVHLIGGEFVIESAPGAGTNILVRVPRTAVSSQSVSG